MQVGAVIEDRFVLIRQAGAGGMGRVFLAEDRTTGEQVAVKVLLTPKPEDDMRFAREARALAGLAHPGLVRYVAHGTSAGHAYIAMEWLEGIDLATRLEHGKLAPRDAVGLVQRVAEALGFAHTRGIVHRDVKPSNVFLVGESLDAVKVIDFGIARQGTMTGFTRSGAAIGTPGYMAPEQARGDRDVDARADVFSLGCVLFECLTGRPPFTGDTIIALLARVLLEDAPRVRELMPEIGPELDAFLARMLSKAAAERPADAAAVARALAALETITALAAPDVSAVPAIGENEQRLVSAVLVSSTDSLDESELESPTLVDAQAGQFVNSVLDVARAHGASMAALADGTVVATLAGTGGATDLAARGARLALAARAVAPAARVALATGRAELGARWPVGEAIERAAHNIELPLPDEGLAPIFIDETTAGLLDGRFDVHARGGAWELRGVDDGAPAVRAVRGAQARFAGRERELATICATLEQCVSAPACGVVLITALDGLGKSRLLREAVLRVRELAPAAILVEAGAPAGLAASPLGLAGRIARSLLGSFDDVRAGSGPDVLLRKIERRMKHADADRVATFLGELLGIGPEIDGHVQLEAARLDPRLLADQRRRAVEDLLVAQAASGPLVMVLDDLHAADPLSIELLGSVLDRVVDRPVYVLATTRPELRERQPDLWAGRIVADLRLGPLGRRASELLARDALGPDAKDDLVQRIVARANGEPLHLVELLRGVASGRGESLPDSVLAMVQARIDALDPGSRRVLRAASVLGEVFARSGIVALVGESMSTSRVDACLDALVEREIVTIRQERDPGSDRTFAFAQGLLRDAAYSLLTIGDRALGHRLAAAWLEAHAGDALDVAEHHERAGAREDAAAHYARAAEQALGAGDLVAALARVECGIALGPRPDAMGLLCWVEAIAHFWRGEMPRTEECAVEALSLMPRGSARWFGAAEVAIIAAARRGATMLAVERAGLLSTEPLDTQATHAFIRAAANATTALTNAAEDEVATELLVTAERTLATLAGDHPELVADIEIARAYRAVRYGDVGTFTVRLEGALVEFERVGDVRRAARLRANVASGKNALGAFAEAIVVARQAISDSERVGAQGFAALARANLTISLARTGALDEALGVALANVGADALRSDARLGGGSRLYLAEVRLLRGELELAEREASAAIEMLSTVLPMLPLAVATLARARLALGRVDEAVDAAGEAFEGLTALGGVEEGEAAVRLIWAEALDAAGRKDEAHEVIRNARKALLERANGLADPKWRASFLEAVPENARTMELALAWLGTV